MAYPLSNTQLSGTAPPPPPLAPPNTPPIPTPKRKLTQKCPWPNCPRYLSCPHNVQQHIREAHTGEKPYACDRCDVAFSRPWGLYRHLRLKHGLEAAVPGRGRGGGLERVGVKGVGGRKGRKGAVKSGSRDVGGGEVESGAAGDGFMSAPPAVHQQQRQQERAPTPKNTPIDFEVNNFTLNLTACKCGALFENREALLAHLHTEHNEPSSPQCNCMLCLGNFGRDVDPAGVHVREKSAVIMRGLMADDLFGFDGNEDEISKAGAVDNRDRMAVRTPVASASKGIDTDTATAQALASVGMTEQQFTANMPKQVQTPVTARANAVAQDVEDISAAEFEDLAAWLGSAEDVYGDEGVVEKLSMFDEMDMS